MSTSSKKWPPASAAGSGQPSKPGKKTPLKKIRLKPKGRVKRA